VVVADDLGWGDAGCYAPASLVPTPALDRLATEGLRLTHARTPSALCTPSRYALLTGSAHWRTAAPRPLVDPYDPPVIEQGALTLASALRELGYRTAAVGKWHLGLRYPSTRGGWTQSESAVDFHGTFEGGPTALGFDHFFGTAGCSTSDPPYTFIEDDRFPTAPTAHTPSELAALPGVLPGAMDPAWDVSVVDDVLVDHALGLLEEHARASTGPPLLLYLALSAPHNPWEAPPALRGVTGDGQRGDMAAWFDRSVGRVLDGLARLELSQEALVIVTSDHGPQYEQGPNGHRPTGPFRGRKNTVWEGGLRVPFWVRWPGRIRAGATSSMPLVHTDLFPTLLALASTAGPGSPEATTAAFEGVDQSRGWLGDCWAQRPATLFECGGARHRIGGWAVIERQWKLIIEVDDDGREGPCRLYDLAVDPGEQHDRSNEAGEARAMLLQLGQVLRDELTRAGWASLADPPSAAR